MGDLRAFYSSAELHFLLKTKFGLLAKGLLELCVDPRDFQ